MVLKADHGLSRMSVDKSVTVIRVIKN